MSHLTYLETTVQNLFYLKKTLKKKNIVYKFKEVLNPNLNVVQTNLVIPQSHNQDLTFHWDGQEYKLLVDKDLWDISSPIDYLHNKISKQYAEEVVIGESQKLGFYPVRNQQKSDGSSVITLERFNNSKTST